MIRTTKNTEAAIAAEHPSARVQRRVRAPGAALYNQVGFNPDAVVDLPVVQRTVTAWAAAERPPGATSVFAFGASL